MAHYVVQRSSLPVSRVLLGAALVLVASILGQPTVVSADTTYAVYDPDPRYRVRLDTSVDRGSVENSIRITAQATLQFNSGSGFFDTSPSTPSTWGITGDTYVYQEIPSGGVLGSTGVDGGSVTKLSAAPGLGYTFRTTWRGVFSGTTFATSHLDMFTLSNPPPSTPSGLAVSPDPSTEGATLTFSWNAAGGAGSYTVDTDSGPCAGASCSVAGTSIARSGYAVGGHWVRVKACRTGASPPCSAFSAEKNFTVNAGVVLAVPTNPRVTPITQRHGDTATIQWDAVAGATQYVMYSSWPGCSPGCQFVGTQVGPEPNTDRGTGAKSFWVKACTSSTCGHSTNPVSFTIQSNDAAFVSQNVPNTVRPGETFTARVTFRNTGASTWDAPGQYVLRSEVGSFDEVVLGPFASPTVVAPNQTVTFSGPLTIASSGTYPYRWRMYRKENNFGFFGQSGPDSTIRVTGPVSAEPIRVKLQIRAKQHLPIQ